MTSGALKQLVDYAFKFLGLEVALPTSELARLEPRERLILLEQAMAVKRHRKIKVYLVVKVDENVFQIAEFDSIEGVCRSVRESVDEFFADLPSKFEDCVKKVVPSVLDPEKKWKEALNNLVEREGVRILRPGRYEIYLEDYIEAGRSEFEILLNPVEPFDHAQVYIRRRCPEPIILEVEVRDPPCVLDVYDAENDRFLLERVDVPLWPAYRRRFMVAWDGCGTFEPRVCETRSLRRLRIRVVT